MSAKRVPAAIISLLMFAGFARGAGEAAPRGDAAIPAPPAFVILVRHAEKAEAPPDDPPLTEAGRARARALSIALRDAGVTAIVTSDALRTRETAGPIADALRIAPRAVGLGSGGIEAHVAAVAAEVRRHPGEVVLVVGHSDTIPDLIRSLGGERLPRVHGVEFDDLFVLVPGADGARLIRSRYGPPVTR